ncbi:hypothetical protein CMO92_00100 [Candidatus Woesearchaeota archaeon]|nr:hypothetical protein [Candidatus Woesearchaeota archaeon]
MIEINENLANEYVRTAEETLEVLKTIEGKSKVWLATTKYYCEYFSIYALLMKLGIKCEIHECTIEVSKFLEKEGLIPEGYSTILEEDKQLRIDNQYYLKNRDVPIDYDALVDYVLKIKEVIQKLTEENTESIRDSLKRNPDASE